MHGPESSDPPTTILYFLPPPPLPAFSLPPFPPTEVERRGGHIPPPFVCVGLGCVLFAVSGGRWEKRGDQSAAPVSLTPSPYALVARVQLVIPVAPGYFLRQSLCCPGWAAMLPICGVLSGFFGHGGSRVSGRGLEPRALCWLLRVRGSGMACRRGNGALPTVSE